VSLRLPHLVLACFVCICIPLLATGCRGRSPSPAAEAPAATTQPVPPALTPSSPATQAAQAPASTPADTEPLFLPVPARYRSHIIRTRLKGFPEKLLALTFDDGPSKNITPRILDTLKKHGAHATFFELGSCIDGEEAITRRIYAEGHAIGSHSYNHPASTTPEKAITELKKTAVLIKKCTGHSPQLFRPPYGNIGNLVKEAQREGYVSLLWTISSADTDAHATVDKIANNVIHTPNPGDIVLMHDSSNHDFTARALPRILDELGAAGFKFVTIPELLSAWDKWLSTQAQAAPTANPPIPPKKR